MIWWQVQARLVLSHENPWWMIRWNFHLAFETEIESFICGFYAVAGLDIVSHIWLDRWLEFIAEEHKLTHVWHFGYDFILSSGHLHVCIYCGISWLSTFTHFMNSLSLTLWGWSLNIELYEKGKGFLILIECCVCLCLWWPKGSDGVWDESGMDGRAIFMGHTNSYFLVVKREIFPDIFYYATSSCFLSYYTRYYYIAPAWVASATRSVFFLFFTTTPPAMAPPAVLVFFFSKAEYNNNIISFSKLTAHSIFLQSWIFGCGRRRNTTNIQRRNNWFHPVAKPPSFPDSINTQIKWAHEMEGSRLITLKVLIRFMKLVGMATKWRSELLGFGFGITNKAVGAHLNGVEITLIYPKR